MVPSKTLKSIPKAKVWYKYLKPGDKVLVQLHPNHVWYHKFGDDKIEVRVRTCYPDDCLSTETSEKHLILIGPEGTDWDDIYPATIIKKIKPAK